MLTHTEVLKRIIKAKKPNRVVPGDLPKKLVQNFASALAVPMTTIFNRITEFADYPCQWKIEQQIAIPKTYPPS